MFICNYKIRLTVAILSLFLTATQLRAASDYQREQRWANEVIPGLIVGEPIYLTQKNQHKFLGIYSETDNKKMGLVIAHGMGLNPDAGMISVLRQGLFDYDYTSLSIQMPILAADASYKAYPQLFPDAAERLQIAVSYLKNKDYQNVAIVSHSNGSRMSRVYMVTNPSGVTAWVALSLTQGDSFKGIKAPVFDLYGKNDLPHVLNSVKKRKTSFKGNKVSKQMAISDANHFFSGKEQEMIDAVKAFLDSINTRVQN